MGCATTVVKYSVVFLNLILLFAGIAFVILGKRAFENHFSEYGSLTIKGPITIIAIGCIIVVITFLGYRGAITESIWMLSTNGVIMLVISLVLIGLGTFGYITFNNASENLKFDLSLSMIDDIAKYGKEYAVTKRVDSEQQGFKCCGALDPADWKGKQPPSCCPDQDCRAYTTFSSGCVSVIFEQVENRVNIILIIVFTLAGIKLAAAIVAFCLTICIRNNLRRSYYSTIKNI